MKQKNENEIKRKQSALKIDEILHSLIIIKSKSIQCKKLYLVNIIIFFRDKMQKKTELQTKGILNGMEEIGYNQIRMKE